MIANLYVECGPSSPAPACIGPPRHHQPPSNVQSRRELGRTPPCLLPPGAAAHKEEEVIASWFCFAAGHQSPPLQMVGYKQQQKNWQKWYDGGYCTCTMAVVLLVTASFTLANCQLQSNVCHHWLISHGWWQGTRPKKRGGIGPYCRIFQ